MKVMALGLLLLPSLACAQAWRPYFKEAAFAGPGDSCERTSPARVGQTQAYAGSLRSGKCFVSIHSMALGMVYRDYSLFSDGMLMVFSSYGEAEGPEMTSAREYYFFPRGSPLRLELDGMAGTIEVRMADGGRASFDPATGQLSTLERGSVAVSPRVDRQERGGVEIPSYRGLMLDAGFRLGELPSGLPEAESAFRDFRGQRCAVKNSEIFAYKGGDHALKHDDAGLSAFLKSRCPSLVAGF